MIRGPDTRSFLSGGRAINGEHRIGESAFEASQMGVMGLSFRFTAWSLKP